MLAMDDRPAIDRRNSLFSSTRHSDQGGASSAFLVIWLNQIHVADAESLCEFIERHDSRIPTPVLKAAQILLAEPGARFNLLLGQATDPTQAGKVPPDQLAHIHARLVAVYTL